MHTPFAFLRFAAKAALNAVGGGMLGEMIVEVVPEIALDMWQNWGSAKSSPEIRDEIQQIAQADPAQIHEEAKEIVQSVAGDRPEEIQLELLSYIEQVPAAIRQSLRRPADPTGTTMPGNLAVKQADDLIPFLPTRMPRFQPNTRPPGIGDWELEELIGMADSAKSGRLATRTCPTRLR